LAPCTYIWNIKSTVRNLVVIHLVEKYLGIQRFITVRTDVLNVSKRQDGGILGRDV
jgi:hypothetical protein